MKKKILALLLTLVLFVAGTVILNTTTGPDDPDNPPGTILFTNFLK